MGHPDTDRSLPVPERAVSSSVAPVGEFEALDLGEVIGAGGTATVYAARLVDDPDRVVALKRPHVPDSAGQRIRDRFRREAETWAGLDEHDHVVSVLGWDTDPAPWIALEYMDGGTLVDRIGECDQRQGLWIGSCVAAALDNAHRSGVTHLDIKPSNVLFAESGAGTWAVPKVSDWGTARVLQRETVNVEGLSPRYAAPEQFASDRFGPVGPATDVYQLGVVLYELFAGRAPFEGPPRTLRDAVLADTPPPPSGLNTTLDPALDDLLDRALAKDPADRYDSMYVFRRELERLLADSAGHEPETFLAGTRRGAVAERPPDTGPAASPRGERASDAEVAPFERALALADEGFVQLSEGYFARRDPAPPLEAWRRGVTLADAHAGRAVKREVPADESTGETRDSLTGRLLEGLSAGDHHAVLGPPGSGKSTVCKQVACEWFDRGYGPVFYRESSASDSFDQPAALARRVTTAGGHALVVVEDAVRPDAEAVFAFLDRVYDRDDVTVLVDARESEWRETERGSTAFDAGVGSRCHEKLHPVFVPRPDTRELERFVEAVEAAADRPIDVDVDQLRTDVRRVSAGDTDTDESRPGELFYLLHRLTALVRDPLSGEETGTTLTEVVADVFDRLADVGAGALDVGICVHVLNAAGIGVYPELLYAVVPDDSLAVHDAIDALDGRVVFPRETDWSGGTTAYPAVHEAWSTAFLAHCLDTAGEDEASQRFGSVVTQVLALADDATRREQVSGALDGDAPYLAHIEADSAAWADETAEAVYRLGLERPKLAPLFGDGEHESVTLPASCSNRILDRRLVWLGRLYLAGGYFDRARRAFERLPAPEANGFSEGLSQSVTPASAQQSTSSDATLAVEGLLGLARVATRRGEYDDAEAAASRCLALLEEAPRPALRARAKRVLGKARAETDEYRTAVDQYRSALEEFETVGDRRRIASTLHELGIVSRRQGEYDRAHEYFERALVIRRDLGDRRGKADTLNSLGNIAERQSQYDLAREYFERGLAIRRELGDRQGVASCLANLGNLARHRGEYEDASAYHEQALEIDRELGDHQGEAISLVNLGNVAYRQGEYDQALQYHERSRELLRKIGDKRREKHALSNLAIVTIRLGEYEEAREYTEIGIEIAREIGDQHGVAVDLGHLGTIARLQGEYDRARDYLERSHERYRELGFSEGEAYTLNHLGKLASLGGEDDSAREYLERALSIASDIDNPVETATSCCHLGDLARQRGKYSRAHEYLERGLDAVGDGDEPFETATIRLARARLALDRGNLHLAKDRTTEALDTFTDVGADHMTARSRRLLGRVTARAGETALAREHWRTALDTFLEVGAPQDALATLQSLHETSLDVDDAERVEQVCRQAERLLDSAPDPVAEQHRGWVEDACWAQDDR